MPDTKEEDIFHTENNSYYKKIYIYCLVANIRIISEIQIFPTVQKVYLNIYLFNAC